MAERHSLYERQPADHYATPFWVTRALLRAEDFPQPVWECAPGDGHMVSALADNGNEVVISPYADFLADHHARACSIVTNPPYKLADIFIRHALELTQPFGKVAMLLPVAYDTARSRRDLFRDCPAFKAKYQLIRRIRWANLEQKDAGPSMNHAWFVWDHLNTMKPVVGYLEGSD